VPLNPEVLQKLEHLQGQQWQAVDRGDAWQRRGSSRCYRYPSAQQPKGGAIEEAVSKHMLGNL